ncbi:hypothetical protein OC842_002682 [Tilletia horrida]|uniref:SART-1 protein n=1 Tax=Tilletia horrida TaxID=155126 RepID=A0AAN6GHI9_9BASI|nr:hypothetical protein OC842_002682 [Tilletia horrida]
MPTEVTREELEELNAQRIKLGLKPLDVEPVDGAAKGDGAGAEEEQDPDALAEANFSRVKEDARREREQKALEERIAKAKNKRELARRLVGKGLGEADEGSDEASKPESTLSWLKASKKRAKENAARRQLQQQIEEQEAQVQAEYGQSDLTGLRIGHDFEEFEEGGEERILTLRDARVLEDAEDELVDSVLAQRERDEENAERRKGAKKYTGLDDEEFGASSSLGKKRGVLSKYDADLDGSGAARKDEGEVGFRIGGPVQDKSQIRAQQAEEEARLANRQLLNLDYSKNVEVSDYLTEGEVGFKKSKGKKKKRAATKIKVDVDDEEPNASNAAETNDGDVDMADSATAEPSAPIPRGPRIIETDNFVDDDELQASLAKARRQKAKKTLTKFTPEQIAANLAAQRKEEAERDSQTKMEVDEGGAGGDEDGEKPLTFDSTTEFVRNLAFKAAAEEPRRTTVKTEAAEPSLDTAQDTQAATSSSAKKGDADTGAEAKAGPSSEAITEFTESRKAKVEDGGDEDEDMDLSDMDDLENLEVFAVPSDGASKSADAGNGPEPLAGSSMAATLSLLRQQGLLQEYTPDLRDKEAKQREYDLWMAEKRRREAVREKELAASKARGSAVDQATREYENQQRDLADAREAQRRFENYKPDVDIKYHDQHGRELSAKKAWKLLSHRFHGKGPGHKKQELEMRRLENERKREKMQSGDTPTGMSKAFQDRSERTGQAHMVLSVGARGNAPQELSMLGPDITKSARPAAAPAAANSSKGKGKGKSASASARSADVSAGITSIGLQSFVPRNVGGSGLASVLPSQGQHRRNGVASVAGGLTSMAPPGQPAQSSGDSPGPSAARPAMKPAFAPIKRAAAANPPSADAGSSNGGSPAPGSNGAAADGSRFKLQLGTKRKAEDAVPAREPEVKRRA